MSANQPRLQPAETAVVVKPVLGSATHEQPMTPYSRGKAASKDGPAWIGQESRTVRVEAEVATRQGGRRR
jgi:hypothetical protein